jgi:biotin transport system substrate-specific component
MKSLPRIYEFLWIIIGVLLMIGGMAFEVYIVNFPWEWSREIKPHSLWVFAQVGVVLLISCVGGKNSGVWTQIVYLMLGLYGLPIFAQGGGLSYVGKPAFGYLLGFLPAAWVCGELAFKYPPKLERLWFSSAIGLGIIHLCGLIYLLFLTVWYLWKSTPIDVISAIVNYSAIALPGQLCLICATSLIAFVLRKILFY